MFCIGLAKPWVKTLFIKDEVSVWMKQDEQQDQILQIVSIQIIFVIFHRYIGSALVENGISSSSIYYKCMLSTKILV